MEDDALVIALWRKLQPLVIGAVRDELGKREDDDGYMTVAMAAAYAKLKPATIREWAKSGKLRAKSTGRQLRITRADLEAAMSAVRTRRPNRETAEDWARREVRHAMAKRR
jgi:excisionase family DNA binding protein